MMKSERFKVAKHLFGDPMAISRVHRAPMPGSSEYVQWRMREYFYGLAHPNIRGVAVTMSRSRQTTIVRGLLEDHKQKMEIGNMLVPAPYVAQASYGVVDRELYDPTRHVGEPLEDDEFDQKQRWAVNQIHWIIHKV
ncbi:hypothetical protein N0V84_008023 [Fusarium piperis]|uniref:Uncharacterized protein n=1 Tax=Fusarium piperis TaxID=1435070 RepID=A0A9W8W907_9HYPO|nr:hypothetical protein N0V84_008023 [Fusarium piperis]